MPSCRDNKNPDWVANRRNLFIAWLLPGLLIVISWLAALPLMTTGIIWAAALTWMGIACLKNASQCGRRHCFYSGPYFILSALIALCVGFEWTIFSALTLNQLALFLAIATPLVCILPDWLWGKYKKHSNDPT